MKNEKTNCHWPTILMGLAVGAVLLTAVFSFQLDQSESAVVSTFGRPQAVTSPGLHFRWPFPFQRIYRFDHRVRCFEGGAGKLEETLTSDQHNILVGIYITWQIDDVEKFFITFNTISNAEEQLNSWMRGFKNAAFGQYRFDEIINTDGKNIKINDISRKIKENLSSQTSAYGIKIINVGINTLNVPKTITEQVFARMIAERQRIADKNLAEGESEARQIRIKADSDRTIAIADAEAKAKEIRAKGDAEAAAYYAAFQKDPELALFLRQLDSLRRVLKGRTTLVLDTDTAPFNLLKSTPDIIRKKD